MKAKSILILILSLNIFMHDSTGQIPGWEWAKSIYNPSTGSIHYSQSLGGICVDSIGNSYIDGSFHDSIRFGNDYLYSPGNASCYFASYDSSGNLRWVNRTYNQSGSVVNTIATNSSNEIFSAVSFSDSISFNGHTIYGRPGYGNISLMDMDQNGNYLWSTNISCLHNFLVNSISADQLGSICVCGTFRDTVFFNQDSLIGPGPTNIFLVKYSGNGHLLYKTIISGANVGSSMVCEESGRNIYLSGIYQGATSFGSSLSNRGTFIAKYNMELVLQWVIDLSGVAVQVSRIKSPKKVLYAAGWFNDSVNINGVQLNCPGVQHNVFLARFESNGSCSWAKKIDHHAGSGQQIRTYGLVVGENQEYISGEFEDSITFGGSGYCSNTSIQYSRDIFVATYDDAGNEGAFLSAGSPYEDYCFDAGGDGEENIYISGRAVNPTYFGNQTIPDSSFTQFDVNVYVAKTNIKLVLSSMSLPAEEQSILFPNPSSGKMIIMLPFNARNELKSIEIMDESGKIIKNYSYSFIETGVSIDCNSLASGIYLINLRSNSGLITKKFVKE